MIKKLIIAVALLLPIAAIANPNQPANANPINQKINQMFTALKRDLGVSPRVGLIVGSEMQANAETDGFVVYLSRGMVSSSRRNYNTIAAILGHEIAHIKLGHAMRGGSESLARRKQDELDADAVGMRAAERIGYNRSGVCNYMRDLQEAIGDPPASDEHPSFTIRMRNLGCGR